jgi:hypothetical protein
MFILVAEESCCATRQVNVKGMGGWKRTLINDNCFQARFYKYLSGILHKYPTFKRHGGDGIQRAINGEHSLEHDEVVEGTELQSYSVGCTIARCVG